MKPSEKAKAVGFKSLSEAAKAAGEHEQNFFRWSEAYPRRFELILKGLVFERMSNEINAVFDSAADKEEVPL